MEFEQYAAARDLLYLSALFAGAGLGCILNWFRTGSGPRFRSRTITLALCLFSGMVVALAGALIYSNGLILFEKPLYIPVVIAASLLILAVRFPRAAGFPLILISGFIAVWIGYSYLQFPRINSDGLSLASITNEGNGQYTVRLAVDRGKAPSGSSPGQDLRIQIAGKDQSLEFFFIHIAYAPPYPLVGGENRGIITKISDERETFYSDPRLDSGLLRGWYTGALKNLSSGPENWYISFEESHDNIPPATFLPGMALKISFDGNALLFN
jgi:hypothetical protein